MHPSTLLSQIIALSEPSLGAIRGMLRRNYAHPSDRMGFAQILSTILPIGLLWTGIGYVDPVSISGLAIVTGLTLLLSLFLIRVFVLMHECGHASLFRSPKLNTAFGFVLGVLAGMPQGVWARRHQHHHASNGNWARYRGPLNVVRTVDYAAMNLWERRCYRWSRSIWLAPVGGFLYLIFAPRVNWLRGTVVLARHALRGAGDVQASPFPLPYCESLRAYQHMLWNNFALLALGAGAAAAIGPVRFLVCYVVSLSLAGGCAVILFAVQHNFEHSYASSEEGWDRDRAVIDGTSFLIFPKWLNWLTADIAYHHIHHLCSSIPNYHLARCHTDLEARFRNVTRLRLEQIPRSLLFILWDVEEQRLVSVAQFDRIRAA